MKIATAGGLIRRCFGLHQNGSYQFFVKFFVLVYFHVLPSEVSNFYVNVTSKFLKGDCDLKLVEEIKPRVETHS